MKKIKKNNLVKIKAGAVACGWVGMFAVVAYSSPGGALIASVSGLNSEIGRCWNS
ncbi:hypothetical protein [Flavobacterium anhuiense]|uniref:hypothetical protein n=1 Tax=Flavobacterium anhuiense TaxID=459526 RepID=UPI001643484B|nr:hypothetical protein [Flavobacterium anhuiense]